MKTNLRFAVIMTAVVFVLGLAGNSYSQRPVLGGFKKVSVEDSGVTAAADQAIEAQADKAGISIELVEIVSAESQVVAGTNYKICMKVSSKGEGEEAAEYYVMAVISRDLKGNYKLSSWSDSDCGGEEEAG